VRSRDNRTGELYIDLEAGVRRNHPLRARDCERDPVSALERAFAAVYLSIGQPSIPSEKAAAGALFRSAWSGL
jgi:hypothetical protein